MSKKFIPNSDVEFKVVASNFAQKIASDAQTFGISSEDGAALLLAQQRFEEAYMAAHASGARSSIATHEKREARAALEKIMRRIANLIRANPAVTTAMKITIGMRERAERSRGKTCPQEPPRLTFARALHGSHSATPMHELRFSALHEFNNAKPDGAVRLELFVDLIPPDAPIPNHPGDNHGGRAWYLRSYTRSPIVLAPPLARVPMRVIYWARWADSTGNVGPFCAAAAGWVEGGNVSRHGLSFNRNDEPKLLDVANGQEEPVQRETYTVALIEAHCVSFNPQMMETMETQRPKLEATVTREARRIEGPAEMMSASRG